MVPAAGRPNSRAASTFDVATKPVRAEVLATAMAASTPWVRRNEKSTRSRPAAASTHRAALEASVVSSVMRLRRKVSASCASAMGAVTSRSGSPASTMRPSGTAHTSPVNRRSRKAAIASSPNPNESFRYDRSPASK